MANEMKLVIEGCVSTHSDRALVKVSGDIGAAEFEVPGGAIWTRGPWRSHLRSVKGMKRLARRLARQQGLVPGGLHRVSIVTTELP